MQRVLVTGANRGLGLEFVRRYVERGERVFAGCRKLETARQLQELRATYPERLTLVVMDVADANSIRAAHTAVRSEVDRLDLLINNAGIYTVPEGTPQQLGHLSFEPGLAIFRVNALGPLLVAQEYLDLLRGGSHAKVVNITSGYGSLTEIRSTGPYYYCASKAALNMFTRLLAADLARFGITVVSLDPGWVATDMGGPHAPLTPQRSVDGMIRVIDALALRHNGHFLNWRGNEQPW